MYFKNDRLSSYIKGYLEVEEDDWSMSIGFCNMRVAGDHSKRRLREVVGAEARLE